MILLKNGNKKEGEQKMIILKMIFYLTIILLILLDIALSLIIWYFANYKQTTFIIENDSDDYIEKAKEIIRKEGTD